MNRGVFPCPSSCLGIWSRETGPAVPSRVNPLILHTQAECVISRRCRFGIGIVASRTCWLNIDSLGRKKMYQTSSEDPPILTHDCCVVKHVAVSRRVYRCSPELRERRGGERIGRAGQQGLCGRALPRTAEGATSLND